MSKSIKKPNFFRAGNDCNFGLLKAIKDQCEIPSFEAWSSREAA
ncbi:MAG TPA: hypothetical protein VNH64_08050 [Parvularculaceae bacterium]|nr:hypothetical protein [Parvularculaceae bacterium]